MRTENGFCIGVKSVVEPGDGVTGSVRNTTVFHTTTGGIYFLSGRKVTCYLYVFKKLFASFISFGIGYAVVPL